MDIFRMRSWTHNEPKDGRISGILSLGFKAPTKSHAVMFYVCDVPESQPLTEEFILAEMARNGFVRPDPEPTLDVKVYSEDSPGLERAAERARIRREMLALDIYDLTGVSEGDLEAGEPVKPSRAKRVFRETLDRICPPPGKEE